jgi:hypothetical protein
MVMMTLFMRQHQRSLHKISCHRQWSAGNGLMADGISHLPMKMDE